MKKIAQLLFSLFISAFSLLAIEPNDIFLPNNEINPGDSNRFSFDFYANSFFKNNEYFSDFIEGYTVIGYIAEPRISFQAGANTKISAGLSALKFSGIEGFSSVAPILTIHHKATSFLDIFMGNINEALAHHLPEPIYGFDTYLYDPTETGLQFLINTKYFESDVWVDWEHFIFKGDPLQEKLTGGTSSRIKVVNNTKGFSCYIPAYTVFRHKGGQINSIDLPMQTIANLSSGLILEKNFEGNIEKIFFNGIYIRYLDMSPNIQTIFANGYGWYPQLGLNTRWFTFTTAYWNGYHYFSSKGEPMFHNTSSVYKDMWVARREMITSKVSLSRRYRNGLRLGVRCESYYDLGAATLEYSYSFFLVFDRSFLFGSAQ